MLMFTDLMGFSLDATSPDEGDDGNSATAATANEDGCNKAPGDAVLPGMACSSLSYLCEFLLDYYSQVYGCRFLLHLYIKCLMSTEQVAYLERQLRRILMFHMVKDLVAAVKRAESQTAVTSTAIQQPDKYTGMWHSCFL